MKIPSSFSSRYIQPMKIPSPFSSRCIQSMKTLRSLFRPTTASKCEKLLKQLITRLNILKSRRICMVRIDDQDVSLLLDSGRYESAFHRIEILIKDKSMVRVYENLGRQCEFMLRNLPRILKQRDSLEDIHVATATATATLIFASARFGELPELVSLRRVLEKMYGRGYIESAVEVKRGGYIDVHVSEEDKRKVLGRLSYNVLGAMRADQQASCVEEIKEMASVVDEYQRVFAATTLKTPSPSSTKLKQD